MNKAASGVDFGKDLPTVIHDLPGNGPEAEVRHIGFFAQLKQATPRHFRRLAIPNATLILVRSGKKIATTGGLTVEAGAGEIVAISAGEAIDVVNMGPDRDHPYQADVFGFDDGLIRQLSGALPPDCRRAALFGLKLPTAFEDSVSLARTALDDATGAPPEIIRHRLSELLLWLIREGVFFSSRREPTVAARVREMVCRDLARDWSAAEIATALHMSEPTLRRRLRGAGTSITETLGDARMSTALGMLQAGSNTIDRIALDVGYASPSKFAMRFRARFGLSPREIRRVVHRSIVSGH